MQEGKVLAIMIGMAFDASCTCGSRLGECSVQAAVLLQFAGNLTMAFETAKVGGPRRDFMAFDAVGWPIQSPMGACQRPWRDLRVSG